MSAIATARKKLKHKLCADLLTDRQAEILRYMLQQWLAGHVPTFREIMAKFQIKSPNGIMCHVTALRKKGYVVNTTNGQVLRLTDKALELAIA